MTKKPLESGRQIGELTLIKELSPGLWKCECSCGKTVATKAELLASHKRRSCGCLFMQYLKGRLKFQMRARAMQCNPR